jgi:hypothetical protein
VGHTISLKLLFGNPTRIVIQEAALENLFGALIEILGTLPVPDDLRNLLATK